MNQILTTIMNLSTLVFVVTGMLAMGLSLTIAQIVAPLRNARLVMMVLTLGLVGLAVLMVSAGELGRRSKAQATPASEV
jgi:BASS family bile acid:Na+ symporter